MTPRQQRLEAIFDEALAIEERLDRVPFVYKQCAEDRGLAGEILGMLEAHEQAEGFLKTMDSSSESPTQQDPSFTEGPGTIIGRYKLLQKIGEGGFGVVYMAEQEEPVRRRVALKIIKLGMDTRQVIARFEAERQALAMMDHPNIAKVFDAGSTKSGRPYFVMELVRGVALTTYCDQENLTTQDRLELFIDVCQAIQHAHLKGVIHRDIKPNNVMVTLHDGKPVPKVIDFGIAKATQQRLTEKTLFTQYQQFIGTPAYMSPEQAEMSGLDVDTRTDVYALGVMLYELLVGKTPFDSAELISAGYDEIRRRIREEEPSKPSTRIATFAQSDLTTVAKHRRCAPHSLAKALRGDLDWIVMTALEKDRQRRYESPSLLAKDVSRYLLDEAVDARPPSIAYRARKFVSRYRVACAAGLTTTVSVLAGLFFSIYGLSEAKKNLTASLANEKQAISERERADREAASVQRLLYPSILAAAIQARREGHRARAEELLMMCPEAERGWEWHYVATHSQAEPQHTFIGHDSKHCVYDVRYETTGQRLVSAGEDGTVRIWDPLSAMPITTFRGHNGPALIASFLSDSKQIASIGNDQTLRILDSKTGTEIGQAGSKGRIFVRAALSSRGSHVVTAERDGTIRLWSSNLEKELAVMPTRVSDISKLAVHDKTGTVATVTGNNRLYIWAANGELMAEVTEEGLGFDSVAFSPSGRFLATGDQEGRVTLRQVREGQRLDSWKAHTRSIGALAFSPDETLLVTTGWEGGISIRDLSSGEELGFFLTNETHTHAVTFSPDGRHLAVAGQRGSLTQWSLNQLRPSINFTGHDNLVFEVVATPDGRHLASVGRDGTLRVWDKQTGVEVRRLRAHSGSIYSLDINANGDRIATRGSDGHWRLWEFPSGRLLQKHAIDHRVRNLRFSPDGSKLATGALRTGAEASTENPAIGIWDVASGRELVRLEGHRGPIMRMDFNPDGTQLVSTSHHDDDQQDGRTLVWDLPSQRAILTLHPEGEIVSNSVLWSSQHDRIYTGHSDGRICFWNAITGELERTLFAHGEMVGALELSNDGKRLLSSAWYSDEAKLWHAETGEFQFALKTTIPGISDVGFANNDRDIIAAGMDGGVKGFSIQPQAPGLYEKQRRVQELTRQTLDSIEHPATIDSIDRLINIHHAVYQESTHGQVDTPSAHQVTAAALDTLAEKHYKTRHFAAALDILTRAQQLTHSDDRDRRIAWITEVAPVLKNKTPPLELDLTQFVGRFQEREFRIEEDRLIYRHRFFDSEWPLTPISPNTFLVQGDETIQLRFKGDTVEGHYFAGNQDLSLRSR